MTNSCKRNRRHQVAHEGALLAGGLSLAQLLAFARNALLGHWLAKGDFGTAAALTMTLQVFETLSDVAVDRMILQSRVDDDDRLIATAHLILVVRGIIIAGLTLLAAPYAARLFGLENAIVAFSAMALVPLIKAFTHLDSRRAQRDLDNRPAVALEILPQAAALLLTIPVVGLVQDYTAVVWLAAAQALGAVAASHALAKRTYKLAFDRMHLWRFVEFGWPILLSALPLLAVTQGDRMIVGSMIGVEALAGYTAAFLVTMVPCGVATRAGLSLMLPLLAESQADRPKTLRHVEILQEAVTTASAAYLMLCATVGGVILAIAFGPSYAGYDVVVAALAVMWAIRLLQVPAGALLMSQGATTPLLIAGFIRATALLPAVALASHGAGLAALALCGAIGECGSFVYVAMRAGKTDRAFTKALLGRSLFLAPLAIVAVPLAQLDLTGFERAGLAGSAVFAVSAAALMFAPRLRAEALAVARNRLLKPASPPIAG